MPKSGFTLSEVLITVAIVGVVAVMTLPLLITNINIYVNSMRQANIALKVTKAMEKMQALGLLEQTYYSTDDFVNELQNHLIITKRCSSANISDCWPVQEVTTSYGEKYKVKNAILGEDIQLKSNTTDNVGLVLADGASIIITYNQNSSPILSATPITASFQSLPAGFGKYKDFAYTSSATSSIDFVMDVNGRKGPNSETFKGKFNDIRSFKKAKFSKLCDINVSGIGCIVNIGQSYEAINTCEDKTYDSNSHESVCAVNYWAGAKKACADIGMQLIDDATANQIYARKDEIPFISSQSVWTSGSDWASTAHFVSMTLGPLGGSTKYSPNHALCVR